MSEAPEHVFEGGDLGPGAMLARARAERGLNIAEVAEHLKYRARQIEALEGDDYGKLPESAIVRGMIRSYAKLVGKDPVPFLKAFERCMVPAHASVELSTQRIPFPDGSKRTTHLYVALSVIVLLAIVVVLYEWHFSVVLPPEVVVSSRTRTASAPAPVMPVTPAKTVVPAPLAGTNTTVSVDSAKVETPVAAAPAASDVPDTPVAIPPAGEVEQSVDGMPRIEFEFQRESWVEIKDRGGKILLSQINPAGTQKAVEGEPPLSITIGNAGGVRVTYKGVPVDLKRYMKSDVARLTLE